MIALIDYGAGNLGSVEKALRFLRADLKVVREPSGLIGAQSMVLPGVGAFDDCMDGLSSRGLTAPIREWIREGKPFLGICVGYQVLFERSEEFASKSPGLAIFPGRVVRFTAHPGLKIPQIGWNTMEVTRPGCPLFRDCPGGSYFYFVHSYYPRPEDPGVIAGQTEYGEVFPSVLWSGNVLATQFHPEKSQETGLRLLRSFVEWQASCPEPSPADLAGKPLVPKR